MQIEKFSAKALTVSMLLIVGIVAVAMAFVSETEYRNAAVQAQTSTVARILQVASDATLDQLVAEGEQLSAAAAKALSRQPELGAYLAEAPAGTSNPMLQKLLEAPLKSGLPHLKATAVRLYNSNKQRLMQAGNSEGGDNIALRNADPQQGNAAFWLSDKGSRYSVIRPLGDRTGQGYLEISFDPVFTLQNVAGLTGLPLRIQTTTGDPRFETEGWENKSGNVHEVQYLVQDERNIPVAQLVALDDFSSLYNATRQTRNTTTAAFVALIGAVLLIAIMFLNRFLFRPVKAMISDMDRVASGEADTRLGDRALKEFHALANAFNRMNQQVKDVIERERQASEDVKGKVELIQDVVAMAAEGNLTGEIMVYRDQDIISELATGIQQMLNSLNSLVSRIQQSGVQVTSSATEIAATAKQQEATVTEQAATTNQIKATVTEITATSKELLNTMNEVTEVAWKTSEGANAGRPSLQSMEKTMHQMMEATDSISSKLAVLSEKAGNINTVVTTINRVADQTNLLSLNAAIEAEKAGEYGVGFAVVATEIRRLADQTAVATWDIEQMVKEMQSAVSAGVMGMEKFSEEVRHGVDDVRQVGSQLAHIIEQVDTLIPRFEEVNEGMNSQAQGGNQIRDAIVQLSESAQQTADSLRQSNGAIMQLNEAASRLQEGASHFRVSS
ncbi:MAG: methyl-accepting chemotaxis protein [Thiogranum sp.]